MKKLAIISVTLLLSVSMVYGQPHKAEEGRGIKKEMMAGRVPLKKLTGNTVSEQAKTNFAIDFRNVTNAQWKRFDAFDEVEFVTKDGIKMKAYYDDDSKLVGTTRDKKFADLPSKGQTEIKTKYKDYSIGPVLFFNDNEYNDTDMILWATQFDDDDLYFVELTKGTNKIIVKVNTAGVVSLFKQL